MVFVVSKTSTIGDNGSSEHCRFIGWPQTRLLICTIELGV